MKLVVYTVLLFLTLQITTADQGINLKGNRYWGPNRRIFRRSESEEEHCHTDEEEEEEYGKTTNLVRIITMLIILLLSMAFGLLPLKTLTLKYRARISSVANCFGGGVFFGTCFMHLIPEVKQQIHGYVEYVERTVTKDLDPCDPHPVYLEFLQKMPIPEFLECSGFILILIIEKIVESSKRPRPFTQRFSTFVASFKRDATITKENHESIPDGCEGDHEEELSCEDCHSDGATDTESQTTNKRGSTADAESVVSCKSPSSKRRGPLPKVFLSAMKGNLYNRINKRGPEEPTVPGQQKKSAAMLILALSIHSFFEGLAIGVEGTEAVFIQLACAITVHKCVIAFAVGSRLIHSGKSVCGMFWCLFCMCVMTPIGISLAMIIVSSLDSNTILIVSGTIQGVSTGFFLYITFAEMLFQEMKSKQDSFLKVSFMTFGVLLVTASTIWHNWNGAHAHE